MSMLIIFNNFNKKLNYSKRLFIWTFMKTNKWNYVEKRVLVLLGTNEVEWNSKGLQKVLKYR